MRIPSHGLCWLCIAFSAVTGPLAIAATSTGHVAPAVSKPIPTVGQPYYTRYCFKFERGVCKTTNYWRGTLVPVNTRVTLVAVEDKSLVLRLPSNQVIRIKNIECFSHRDLPTVAREMLAPQPVPLGKSSRATADAIKNGLLKLGMTKDQVLMARGYPPGHKTPSIDADAWTYWSSRFVNATLVFNKGVLIYGRGVR